MLIGVAETPVIARRIHSVEVDGVEQVYAFRAILGTGGWCEQYLGGQHYGVDYTRTRRVVGHTRAWIYGERCMVELTPDLVTLDWEIDDGALAVAEAEAMRKDKHP